MPEQVIPAIADADLQLRFDRDVIVSEKALASEVSDCGWLPLAERVQGVVRHGNSRSHTATVRWMGEQIVGSSCTCGSGGRCVHVLALLRATEGTSVPVVHTATANEWRAVATLLADAAPRRDPPATIELQFALTPDDNVVVMPATSTLRGVRHLPWRQLAAPGSDVEPTQALLAAALHDLAPSTDMWLDLGEAGPHAWALLAAIRDAGATFGQAHHSGPEPRLACHLDKALSVQMRVVEHGRADAALIAQLVDHEGQPITSRPHTIGSVRAPHGVAWFDNDQTLHVAPLAARVHPLTMRLAQRRRQMIVPAADIPEFTRTALPDLTTTVPVRDPDHILHEHPLSAPTAVLTIRTAPGCADTCCATWKVVYTVDGNDVSYDVTGGRAATSRDRDGRAETALWADLASTVAQIGDTARNWTRQHDTADPSSPAGGVPTFTVTPTELIELRSSVLPTLAARADLRIDIDDTVPDYRLPGQAPQVRFETVDGGGRDWLKFNVVVDVDGTTVALQTVIEQLAAGHTSLVVGDGVCLDVTGIPDLDRLSRLLKEARDVGEISTDNTMSLLSANATLWDDLLDCGTVGDELADFVGRAATLAAGPVPHIDPSGRLNAELRAYQREGLDWLVFLLGQRVGGILADDMGLGKTVQLLAAVVHRLDEDPAAQFLVVAPTSVVSNWVAETTKFLPGVSVAAIINSKDARPGRPADTATLTVTTYTLLRNNSDYFSRRRWAMVICDEAQMIKTPTVKVRKVIANLPTDTIIAATGTPIENSLTDLWSLLNVAVPHLFPSKSNFTSYYQNPIEQLGDHQRLAELRTRIAPMMLRRTKEQVATELPAKQEQYVDIELGPAHRRIYDRTLNRERQKALELLSNPEENRFLILTALTRLRQLSLHPGLVDPADTELGSAKIDWLLDHLPTLADEGHKILVFSVFPSFLRLVRPPLEAAGMTVAYLDGTTPTADRAAQIDAFTAGDAEVFLIGIKSGGFGINLVASDYVIITDPWWNPATESQAVDRAHRIGQTRAVNVYRLVANDTVEGKVVALQNSKRALATSVIEDDGGRTGAFNSDDLRELLA